MAGFVGKAQEIEYVEEDDLEPFGLTPENIRFVKYKLEWQRSASHRSSSTRYAFMLNAVRAILNAENAEIRAAGAPFCDWARISAVFDDGPEFLIWSYERWDAYSVGGRRSALAELQLEAAVRAYLTRDGLPFADYFVADPLRS
jgi:hypothetical protein